jgi:hypothetical protein
MMIFDLDNPAAQSPQQRGFRAIWLQALAIVALTSLSVLFVMICTCDTPWQTPSALVLLALSLAACLGAASVLFRLRPFLPNSTPILRAVASVGVAIIARFLELKFAIDSVAWLAQRPR